MRPLHVLVAGCCLLVECATTPKHEANLPRSDAEESDGFDCDAYRKAQEKTGGEGDVFIFDGRTSSGDPPSGALAYNFAKQHPTIVQEAIKSLNDADQKTVDVFMDAEPLTVNEDKLWKAFQHNPSFNKSLVGKVLYDNRFQVDKKDLY